ncbi:MAG TPA: MFS transporter [Pseudolabrys sp.]|nr:MFS transporter [Pseudolabrys sp.]
MTSGSSHSRLLTALALLWLAGTGLRLTILAVPPAIPSIHDDLHLSATEVGILTGLPSMLLALAAVPGSLLIARLGAVPALVTGLLLCAAGGALRGIVPDIGVLYGMTVIMGAGVAIMQVAMPPVVRLWAPNRIGFATALYTNGLLIGEILPVALMIPVVLPFAGSWQRAFVFWSIPVAVIALLIVLLAPRSAAADTATPTRRRWWPDWNDGLIWKLGIMLGSVNAMYFGTNAFIPDYLNQKGQGEWISATLTALNVAQLPASFLLLAVAERLKGKAWPYALCGTAAILALIGVIVGNGIVLVLSAALIGFVSAIILVLALALPPLLAPPDDVHRVTAAMFTISYSCAVITPVISGAIWDLTGIPQSVFVPFIIMTAALVLLAPSIRHTVRRG